MTARTVLQRHLVIIGTIIIVAGLVAASETLHDMAEEAIVWGEGVISAYPASGMIVFVLLAAVSAMVAFFSIAVLAPVAVYAWGTGICLVLLWLGWFLGGAVAYCVGRFLGRSVVSAIIGADKVEAWGNRVNEKTRFVHILLFQAAVPSEIPGYLLGMLRYRYTFYLAALGITELPYAVATVYLGDAFLKRHSMTFILLGVGILALSTVAYQAYRRVSQN